MSATTRFLRRPEVETLVGLRRSALYRRIADGDFPRPVLVGSAACWPENEIADWQRRQIARRDTGLDRPAIPHRRGARPAQGQAPVIDRT